jgi:hypothetical protein
MGEATDGVGRIFLLKALAVAASYSILRLRSDQDQGPRPAGPDSGARLAWLWRRISSSIFPAVMDCNASTIIGHSIPIQCARTLAAHSHASSAPYCQSCGFQHDRFGILVVITGLKAASASPVAVLFI